MITNLLASVCVTLVTNVSEQFPQHLEPVASPSDGPSVYAVFVGRNVPDKDPKEKWVTTNIVEVTTVSFQCLGQAFETKKERPVASWTTHFRLAPPDPQRWTRDTNNAPLPVTWLTR
jgi:hypothetical protein